MHALTLPTHLPTLFFAYTEKHGDIFVPRRFAEPDSGPPALTAELVRLFGTLVKNCGEPDVAAELEDRLQCFPPQLQWLFLQHLQKNPFPDPALPHTLVNLWKVLPVSGLADKASRARLLLLVVEWARALLGKSFMPFYYVLYAWLLMMQSPSYV